MGKHMKSFSAGLLGISLFCAANATYAIENEAFEVLRIGVTPVKWKDYKALRDNVTACLNDGKDETPTCQTVISKATRIWHEAMLQAAVLNVTAPGGRKFCDDYAEELIEKQDTSNALAVHSYLTIENQIKYGAGLYGSQLDETYLSKIVFDGLVNTKHCKK